MKYMKYMKYALLIIVSFILSNITVEAGCTYKEKAILNNDFSNVKITNEVVNEDEINVLVYNITENIYLSYINPQTNEEVDISYYDTDDGKYILSRNAESIEEYNFQIRSNFSSCYGNILTTKKIIKPKYNKFYTLEICQEKGLENHSYCQEYITQEIN